MVLATKVIAPGENALRGLGACRREIDGVGLTGFNPASDSILEEWEAEEVLKRVHLTSPMTFYR